MNNDKHKQSPVILRSYDYEPEAYIALGALRAAGIPCTLENQIMASVLAIPTSEICRIKLLVPAEFAEEADSVLNNSNPDKRD